MAQVHLVPTVSWFAPERMGQLDYYHMARGYPLRGLATRYENCIPGNQLPGTRVFNVRWHVVSVNNLNRTHGLQVTNNFRPPSLTQYGTVSTEKQQLAMAGPVIPIASTYV